MVGSLPITQRGNKYIIVAVEYLSRWQKAKPVPKANAKETSEFLYSLIYRYSRFDHLHSDRRTEFVNEVIQNLTEKFRIKHHHSTPYRPQANRLVERFNKTLCDSLVKLAEESAEWDKLVEPALYAHRTTVNNSTGLSPYNIVFGIELRLITDEDDRNSQDWWKRLLNIVDGLPQLRE